MSLWALGGLVFGGAFLLEGVMWALFPNATRETYRQLMELPASTLQVFGLLGAVLGALLVILVIR